VDFFGEGEEFEFAAGVADGGEAADEFADAGGVDVVDVGEVENDFLLSAAMSWRTVSRSRPVSSPRVMRPLMSTMVTWLTSRVVRCMGIRASGFGVNGIGDGGVSQWGGFLGSGPV